MGWLLASEGLIKYEPVYIKSEVHTIGYELTYDYVACYCSAHWFSGYHNCGDQSMAVHGGRRWSHFQWTTLSMTRSTS